MSISSYGLEDPELLEAAAKLAPALFSALKIAQELEPDHFPIRSDEELERALAAVANDGDQFSHSGLVITKAGVNRFPDEFLPIANKLDLVEKVYLAIIISHRAQSQQELERIRNQGIDIESSHPFQRDIREVV